MHDPQPTVPAAAPLLAAITAPSPPVNAARPSVQVIDDFLHLPQRLRSPELSEAEMEAITVCSAPVLSRSSSAVAALTHALFPHAQSGGASLYH